MNTDELFINEKNLPFPLERKQVYELFEKIKFGDQLAKEKLVSHNIRLVINIVNTKYKDVQYDKKELVGIGIIGLLKAIDKFDITKNIEFSTYATIWINGEISSFFKKIKKYKNLISFEQIIKIDHDGNDIKLNDILTDDFDMDEYYIDHELSLILRKIINNLDDIDKRIILLYFGFIDNKTYTQSEISKIVNISQPKVSKIISNTLQKIKTELIEDSVLDINFEKKLI